MSNGPSTATLIGLPARGFARVFPFYFAWDAELRVSGAGPSLEKICADVRPGVPIQELFVPIRPEGEISASFLREHEKHLLLFKHRATGTRFRGQILPLPDKGVTVMLASPWLQDTAQVEALGITFADFAIHDQSLDLLQLLQTQQMANDDLKKLTERLTAQRAKLRVQEAEARKLALVAARTDNAVVVTDAKGLIEWVNDGFARLTGWSLEEVAGRTPGSILQGPDTDPATVALMRANVREGKAFKTEILNYHKSGRRYWVSIEGQPILDADGKVTNFMAIEADITQRRRDEQRRALQFSVSSILADASSIKQGASRVIQSICNRLGWITGGIWMRDPSADRLQMLDLWHDPVVDVGSFVSASRSLSFERGVGLPGRVWATRRSHWVQDVVKDDNFPRAPQAAASQLHGALALPILNQGEVLGVIEFFSSRIEEPDDDLLDTMNGIGNQMGQFVVRLNAEQALRETNTLQRAILEGANYSIISTDPDGVIRTFNTTAERLLGYSAAEMVGKQSPAIIHDATEVAQRAEELTIELGRPVAAGFNAFVAQARLGHADEREWTYVRKDGTRFPVLLSVTALFDERGGITGYVGIASDITDRKRAERELLEAKEQAEAANRAKSDFLATMSHEIRTPMNGIIGMSSLLVDTELNPKQRDMVEAVRYSGEALMTIIEDILDFSKIEARRLDLVEEAFSLDSVIGGVVDLLHHKAAGRNIALIVAVAPDVPDTLMGDPGRLRQILMNLVGNGIKFTDEGHIRIDVRRLESAHTDPANIEISVTDTGIGMTLEQQRQLFHAFTQVDNSSTRRFGGTGLGLAISKRLVELMGGTIGVASRPHEGSRFWVRLPLRAALVQTPAETAGTAADASPAVEAPRTGIKPRILVVEDNEVNSRMAMLMLEKHGYPAEVARDGEEAVDRFASGVYDGILMDCHMPTMDGYEATRAIRELEASVLWHRPRCCIVAMTANVMTGERERCLAAGMDDYISKPLRAKPLLEALNRIQVLQESRTPIESAAWSAEDETSSHEAIQMLADELSVGDTLELIENWLKDTPERILELEKFADTEDQTSLRRTAHSLKGSSSLFGLTYVHKLCREIEHLAESGVRGNQSALVARLKQSFQTALPALRAQLARLK